MGITFSLHLHDEPLTNHSYTQDNLGTTRRVPVFWFEAGPYQVVVYPAQARLEEFAKLLHEMADYADEEVAIYRRSVGLDVSGSEVASRENASAAGAESEDTNG